MPHKTPKPRKTGTASAGPDATRRMANRTRVTPRQARIPRGLERDAKITGKPPRFPGRQGGR